MVSKLTQFYLILFSFVIIVASCISSPDNKCDQTFTETELNEDVSEANEYGIVLKKGCNVKITGYAEGSFWSRSDYFRFNTGEATSIRFVVQHDAADGTDIFLYDPFGKQLKQSIGVGDFDIIDYIVTDQFVPMYIAVWGWNGFCNYSLFIEAS